MSFDAGALMFRIQTVGAKVAQAELKQLDDQVKNTTKSAKESKKPLDEQAKATEEVGKKSLTAAQKQRLQEKAAREQKQAAEEQARAFKELSGILIGAGVAVTALVTLSVVKFTQFDAQMSNVRAATMSTAAEQKLLGEAALQAGADTAYSATEAAAAEEELAKAGMSVSDIVGGSLNGALALAAAGQLQVARSAEIMATTLKQFKLPAEQAAHVSDILAAGAGKAQGSVDDLALALQYVGPVAAGLNISLEETGGTLAYLASQGILGERAGTGLRGVLMSLTAPSAIATRTMGEYGIEIFDAAGNMKSMATISQILQDRLGGLTEAERSAALGRIFGNEQITTARILYSGGAKAIDEWTDAVDDSGYAAEQAAIRQDNLAGDVEKLGGAFETALIKTGSGANDTLREMVQTITELVDWYGELPDEVQATALVIGVAGAAVLLFQGSVLGLTAKFAELKKTLDAADISLGRTALTGVGVGIALAGVITVVSLLAQKQAEARQRAESYASALKQGADSVREFVAAELELRQSALGLEYDSAYEAAEKLGIGVDLVTSAAEGNAAAMKQLKEELAAGGFGSDEFKAKLDELGLTLTEYSLLSTTVTQAVEGLNEARDRGTKANERANEVTEDGIDSSKTAAEAYMTTSDAVGDLEGSLSELIDTIFEANRSNLDTREANRRLIESFSEFDAALAEHGNSLDLNTEAGRENEANLDAIAEAAMDAAKATSESGGGYEEYRASLESSRQSLLDRINDLGITGQAAEDLADKILAIPTESEWKMVAEVDEAATRIERIQNAIAALNDKTITVTVARPDGTPLSDQQIANQFGFGSADGNLIESYANGGVRENHVAQMARAGAWRVWAEPETGGETYVPHAPSKRARSEQIMSETARIFGGTYIPAGAAQYANGSPVSSAPSRAPQPTVVEEHIHLNVDGRELIEVIRRHDRSV
ncbi:hypothetical protein GCM10009775_04730 [Microbacterium aoyamense]|uniref:Phage tail tape measure protein domain-containing protein n=1 Tax=Microbacterium aoyamense TaxID=344166 RepID=A0ABN2P8P2_9MICO|nr:phage tail tape measure protein [Microbacterium aoyamense]